MHYQWSWTVFDAMSPDGVHTYLETLLIGACWTMALSTIGYLFAVTLGSFLGVIRTAKSGYLRAAGNIYVELFRNIPLFVQMFLWYFVLPELLPKAIGTPIKQMHQPWGQFLPALLCLSFYGAARVSETMRSGIGALGAGQRQAAAALGLGQVQTYRYVILPQAFRIIVPPLTSEFMSMVKYTSVAMTIGLNDLTGAARSMQEFSFHVFEAFSLATLIYLSLNMIIARTLAVVERKFAPPSGRRSQALAMPVGVGASR